MSVSTSRLSLKFLFFLCWTFSQLPVHAQRYLNPVFDSVLSVQDIAFGQNITWKGDSLTLLLDLYLPYNDTPGVQRPLVILAHGGSFATGSRKAVDVFSLANRLARCGFVTASIEYRLGADILSGKPLEYEYQQAVWRATQDGRAAVRFFRKSVATGNPYKLNNGKFYFGGTSAGGVIGLYLAFLDQPSEIAQTSIDTPAVGGREGNSGNAGYSSNVHGVISLCGAMEKVGWMQNNTSVSLCLMHGNWDATVPYGTDYYKFLGSPVSLVQGSFSIDSAANKYGMDSRFYTFDKASHEPYKGSTPEQIAYMDTVEDFVTRYLYRQVTGKIPAGYKDAVAKEPIQIYPNPADEFLFIQGDDLYRSTLNLYDMQGKLWVTKFLNQDEVRLDLGTLPKGIYFLHLENSEQSLRKRIVID